VRLAACLMVQQFVAEVINARGQRFRVYRTGDDRFYLFDPLDAAGCSRCCAFPVAKRRLRDDIRRALANGVGYSAIGWDQST